MIIKLLILIMGILHIYIAWFEMFAWETKWKKIFNKFPIELFSQTKSMAWNQGLYNSFLAFWLFWSLCIHNIEWSENIAIFFLICIAIAWIYWFFTIEKKILFIQTIPSICILILIISSYYK